MSKKESEYKVMLDMIDSLKEHTDMYQQLVIQQLDSKGLSYYKLREKLTEYTVDELKEIMAYAMKDEDIFNAGFEGFSDDEKKDAGYDTYVRDSAIDALKDINGVIEGEKEVEDLQANADNVVKEYAEYLTSDKYYEENMKRIQKLKDDLEKETDESMKKRIKNMIDALENRYTLQFMFKRLNEMGEREVKRIVEIFFDDHRSEYVMSRYRTKAKALGYNPDVYKYFLNMEEKYLEPEYHVFNNLFLFVVVNFIAYIDTSRTNDKMYGQAIINSMANTVYEKFPNEKAKNDFLNVMRNVLDFFDDYRELFDEKNYLHPNHPRRIEKDKQREKELREMIYANLGMIDVEINEEIENMSIKDLKAFYQDKLDEIEKAKEEEKNKEKSVPAFSDAEFEKIQQLSYIADLSEMDNIVELSDGDVKKIEDEAIIASWIYDVMDTTKHHNVGIYTIQQTNTDALFMVTITDEYNNVKGTYKYWVQKPSIEGKPEGEDYTSEELINYVIESIKKVLSDATFMTYSNNAVMDVLDKFHDIIGGAEMIKLPEMVIDDMHHAVIKNGMLVPKRGLNIIALLAYLFTITND